MSQRYVPFTCLCVCLSLVFLKVPCPAIQPADNDKAAGSPGTDRLQLLRTFNGEFVSITPGEGKFPKSILMGSETGGSSQQPVHRVTFEYQFSIARYEVPQNLYEAVVGHNPSRWKGPRNSAEMFSWQDAKQFCDKVTVMMVDAKLITADEQIRLPTEAEWEYCCRAGSTTAYSFGDQACQSGDQGNQASILDNYAWHTGNAKGNDPPVGAKQPNVWGLYDLHGYLSEFVADDWHETYQDAPNDGSSWISKQRTRQRVIRGGSWKDRHDKLRSAFRVGVAASSMDDAIGFRCVKSKVPTR